MLNALNVWQMFKIATNNWHQLSFQERIFPEPIADHYNILDLCFTRVSKVIEPIWIVHIKVHEHATFLSLF